MDAEIRDESDGSLVLYVSDGDGNAHSFVVRQGGIVHHETRAYPEDPTERTEWERERVAQAHRYARYFLRRERGWDLVPWAEDSDRIERVAAVVDSMSLDAFEDRFRAFFDQVTSHDYPDRPRPVAVPEAVDYDGGDYLKYMQDVFLDGDRDAIEATSGVYVFYYDADDREQLVKRDVPYDRDPDARLQSVPTRVPTVTAFKSIVEYHLRCQVRDCYVGMGQEPPREYRVLGSGINKYVAKYQYFDEYENYYQYDADVPGYVYDLDLDEEVRIPVITRMKSWLFGGGGRD